jgi:hypothetical protein
MPIFPVRMSGPSSCEWDGTGARTWSVAMEAHPERASITKSAASDFRQFIAYSRPPDAPYLTRANDRLDRAQVIVLDVADTCPAEDLPENMPRWQINRMPPKRYNDEV